MRPKAAAPHLADRRRRPVPARITKRAVSFSVGITLVAGCLWPVAANALEPVRAEIGVASAWVGEAVPLIVTLYSPGPFGEAASFSLPEMPRTVILRSGNPVVGSEPIDGRTVLTQRHEFKLYTRLAGHVTVPRFQVRFSGKASFTADPEPVEGLTSELHFDSKRLEGIGDGSLIMTAEALTAEQQWTPRFAESAPSDEPLIAGDVVQRRVTRTATGTTAMFFDPLPESVLEGVRLHSMDPVVQDRDQRGESSAERIDVLKYQFQQPGTYDLPAITLRWWDARSEQMRQFTLAGLTVRVDAAAGPSDPRGEPEPERSSWWWMAGLGMLAIVLWRPVVRSSVRVRNWCNQPERLAARRLRAACRSNDSREACVALLEWKRVAVAGRQQQSFEELVGSGGREFERLAGELTRRVYGLSNVESSWTGTELDSAFRAIRRAIRASDAQGPRRSSLPLLNPAGSEPKAVRTSVSA